MQSRTGYRRTSQLLITGTVTLLVVGATADGPWTTAWAQAGPQTISVAIPAEAYEITTTERGDEISIPGFGYWLVPGKPKLPSRIFAIAIPPGAEVVGLRCDAGAGEVLPGTYRVPPAPLPRVIGQEDPLAYKEEQRRYDENYASTYTSDDVYPAETAQFVRSSAYRKYNLVDVRVTPLAYRPLSGQLTYYPQVTVQVDYTIVPEAQAAIVDDLVRTERIARDIVLNYDQAASWYPAGGRGERGVGDFVIITLPSLVASVTPMVDWETGKGRTVQVMTTTDIASTYSGYDLAEKMRNFLRDKYPAEEWGIEDVLLVGDYDDVPMRRTAQNVGYGQPETDFYYAELSLPDSESWDADGDHQYGEYSDPIDFYAEVNVGRIPWSDSTTVSNICLKTADYEQNTDPAFKQNMLLLGAYFWPDTDNAVLMEAKVNKPWMDDWTLTRMYEKNGDYWSNYDCDYPLLHSNVMAVWPAGQYAFVNWAGHGSPTSTHIYGMGAPAFITSSDSYSLDDDYPAIIFADACSNSDTDSLNIGKAMLKQGAVGFVGATKVALGCPGWDNPYDGSSQSLDYYFTTAVTSGDYTQGAALQWALRQMYQNGLWDYTYYETFEWGALWGNPDLSMNAPPVLSIRFQGGPPEFMPPGVPTPITVEITSGLENYVPGTAMLHYRFDGGTYQTLPLMSLGESLFETTLPAAGCGATPEFYVSAESDGGSTVTSPYGAPSRVYTALVGMLGTVLADNFETDQGWTAENVGAITGDWQRGVPVNDPDCEFDPISDSDGSGQCFLTQNELGNTDVDNGEVRLITPTMNLSGGEIEINYDYFLRLTNTTGGVDRLVVEIDSNDGAGPWIEIAAHTTNGGLEWRHNVIDQQDLDAAGVELSSTMKLRFTANDADPQSVNEAGVDAIEITAFTCVSTASPPAAESGPPCAVRIDCVDQYAGAECVDGTCYIPKNRYLSVDPTTNTEAVAYQVELSDAVDYPTAEGRTWWVDEPECYDYPSGNVVVPTPSTCAGADRFGWVSALASTPVTRIWTEVPLHISGCGVAPAVVYRVRATTDEGGSLSAPLEIGTSPRPASESQSWGDLTGGPVEGMPGWWLGPDQVTNFGDVGNAIRTFENRTDETGCPPRVWVDMESNQVINMADISFVVMAFEGRAYSDIGLSLIGIDPADCP